MTVLRRSLLATFVFVFTYVPAFGQLGPKDGPNLAPRDLNRIRIGQPAPDFTLENADGKKISLSEYRGKKVILVFYRGHW